MISGGIFALGAIAWIYFFPDFELEWLFIPMAMTAGLPFLLIIKQF